jgi:1,4-dihydroxy-2-naphthoate octaprenyltransferase
MKSKFEKANSAFWSAAFFIGVLTAIIIGVSDNGIGWIFSILIGICVCGALRYAMGGVLALFLIEKDNDADDNNDNAEKE